MLFLFIAPESRLRLNLGHDVRLQPRHHSTDVAGRGARFHPASEPGSITSVPDIQAPAIPG